MVNAESMPKFVREYRQQIYAPLAPQHELLVGDLWHRLEALHIAQVQCDRPSFKSSSCQLSKSWMRGKHAIAAKVQFNDKGR